VREDGNLIYLGRSDFQIKHMGYRIELGEIENKVYSIDEIATCVVVYRDEKIILYYVGNIKEDELAVKLKSKLPNYMIPNKIYKEALIKYNLNGKIDRSYYKEKKEDK
jgi:acyl-coenzyme A synthetase/AMP-(fatty) acid ligase